MADGLKESRVPVDAALAASLGIDRNHVFADFEALHRKPPDHFPDGPEEVKRHVVAVMAGPSHVLPGAEPDHRLVVRRMGADRAVAVEIVLRGGKHRIRTAYILDPGQFDMKVRKALNPSSAVPEPIPGSRHRGQIVQGGGASSDRASEEGGPSKAAPRRRKSTPSPTPCKGSRAPRESRQKATGAATGRESNPEDGSMTARSTGRKKATSTSRKRSPKASALAAPWAKKPARPTSRLKTNPEVSPALVKLVDQAAAKRKPGRAALALNPADGEGLAKVWKAWTGAEPGQSFRINVEEPASFGLPSRVVLLGRVAWFATKAGKETRFGASGPYMVTDAKAERIWLVSHKGHRFDLEPALIGYTARKPKFGDKATVEYVHAFEGRAHAVMDGQVGALTGTFRITPAGLEG